MSYKEFTRRLFSYLRPHLFKLIITSILMILATALESAIPEITGQIVDELFNNDRSDTKTLYYSAFLFVIIFLSAIFSLVSSATGSWVSNEVIMKLRINMFDKLMNLPKSFFDKSSSGNILSKLTFDVEQIAGVASIIWLEFIKALVMVSILVGYLFYKSWELSISLIFILPVIFFAVKSSARRIRNSSNAVQASMGNMTHLLDENISGSAILKIFQAEEYEKNKFKHLIKNIKQQRFKVDLSAALNSNLINVLLGVALSVVVYFSSVFFKMTAGEFLSYFTALAMLIKPSKSLININKPFQIAIAAGSSVFKLLDEKIESHSGKKIEKLNGNIEFCNVSFSYEKNKPVLNNLSFKVSQGETIAIIGATGSGKTTIIDLLAKFYLPQSGSILFDGIDISKINNKSLRSNIAFVDQSARLFNDSVRANIALGRLNVMSSEKVKESAIRAEAIEFIDGLENQFDTVIGDNGQLLSGGQRQRLAIARAIAKDASILILDEATSALDTTTEKLVQKSIEQLSKGKTTIIIAHRLSTIQNADRIIVLKSGEIIEEGTHESLIKNNGYYSHLVQDQYK